jgi:hypothetical protein
MRSVQRVVVSLGVVGAIGIAGLLGAWSQESKPAPPDGPARQPAAVRIATADVLGVVERLVMSERYRPAAEAFMNEQNSKLKPLQDELEAMEKRGASLPPGSPELADLGKQYDQKRDEYQRSRQEAFAKIDSFNTDQVREAYRLTLQAVDQLSQQLGYTHVLASRTGSPTIRSDNVNGALQEMLARPVAKSDPADDLTDRLIKQFKLENVKVDETARPAPPGTGAAPAPAPPPAPK